ncbi:MAG: penicillin-binding protein 2 [Acidobacteria bacterium]|nr:penicillin-binding protein 2 [Acidobacteriota bacterium]
MKNTRRPKKRDQRQVAFTRFMLVVAVFVLWIGGIGARLVHLQVTQHAWLDEKALDIRQDTKQARMLRGTIYDRNERALAMSVRVKTLYADPTEIADIDGTAKTLAKTLKLDANQIAANIRQGKESNKRFVPIAKKLDEDVAQKINKVLDTPELRKADLPNFAGLHWRDEQKRKYPYESLASQVIGFSNDSDDGQAGIEQSQDELLHGAIIKTVQQRDRLGRVYDEVEYERERPSDIVLTIDTGFQYIAEQALARGVQNAQAKSGTVIVMNPKTGEILAMANLPTFDPNNVGQAQRDAIGNNAVQSSYSPGSVFKLVTYSSALEKHLFLPMDMIDAGNGTITVANHEFTDHHTGSMTYAQALAVSSNISAIKTGMRVGKDDFYAMIQKMGFGAKTGVELPAESGGIVRSPEKWNGDSLASMSIGYEINVTPLQMASAFATIANNGIRVQPHIIKEIRRSDEEPKSVTQPQQTQVVTADTVRDLKVMLRQVVLTGTGKRAQLNGYTVAGKTGTAWKVNTITKSVDASKYVSSFIGMAPANDPQILVEVVMDEPKVGARDGGMVSAPVFADVAQQILTEMKVPQDAPLKQESTLAQQKSEVPAPPKRPNEKDSGKDSPKAKNTAPATKPTKPGEKNSRENGRLTAALDRRKYLGSTKKIET